MSGIEEGSGTLEREESPELLYVVMSGTPGPGAKTLVEEAIDATGEDGKNDMVRAVLDAAGEACEFVDVEDSFGDGVHVGGGPTGNGQWLIGPFVRREAYQEAVAIGNELRGYLRENQGEATAAWEEVDRLRRVLVSAERLLRDLADKVDLPPGVYDLSASADALRSQFLPPEDFRDKASAPTTNSPVAGLAVIQLARDIAEKQTAVGQVGNLRAALRLYDRELIKRLSTRVCNHVDKVEVDPALGILGCTQCNEVYMPISVLVGPGDGHMALMTAAQLAARGFAADVDEHPTPPDELVVDDDDPTHTPRPVTPEDYDPPIGS